MNLLMVLLFLLIAVVGGGAAMGLIEIPGMAEEPKPGDRPPAALGVELLESPPHTLDVDGLRLLFPLPTQGVLVQPGDQQEAEATPGGTSTDRMQTQVPNFRTGQTGEIGGLRWGRPPSATNPTSPLRVLRVPQVFGCCCIQPATCQGSPCACDR